VTVSGSVVESLSVMGRGVYRISQGDQGLWVVTQTGAPRQGARVDVRGRLQEGYDLGSLAGVIKVPDSLQSGVVFVESSHKARD
jgi:hypothetical protein